MEPTCPAVVARHSSHWTSKEIPRHLSMGWSGSFALSAFPHRKCCVGKLNVVGIPVSILSPQTYLVSVFFLQSVSCTFTYVSVSPWGGRISLFFCELTCRTEPDRNDSSSSFSQDPYQADCFPSPFLLFCLLL